MAERNLQPDDLRIASPESRSVAVLRARFNEEITAALRDGAVNALRSGGIPSDRIHTFDVPGSFELPQAAKRLDDRMPAPDGIITLGAVIRGETPHFDYICSSATRGIQEVALAKPYPVVFGVLTCDSRSQAEARAGLTEDGQNKGVEAAYALADMIRHQRNVDQLRSAED